MSETTTRHIHGLRVQNVLAVEAIEISPAGSGVTILAGKNGSGKSSLLRAVELLLEWRAAAQKIAQPVLRVGSERGIAELDLGDIIVRRTFTEENTTLTIERKDDRSVIRSPQTFLDAIKPPTLLDPLNFASMSPGERRRVMIEAAGLGEELRAAEAAVDAAEEARRETGRTLRTAQGALDATPVPPKGTPLEPISVGKLYEDLRAAEDLRKRVEVTERAAANIAEQVRSAEERIKLVEIQILQEKVRLETLSGELEHANEVWATARLEAPTAAQLNEIRDQISSADAKNAEIAQAQRIENGRLIVVTAEEDLTKTEEMVTAARAGRDKLIQDAPLPLEGLGFDDEDATYGGIRWASLATSQQLHIGLRLGLAQHPGLPVFVIHRAESLDEEGFQALSVWAQENNVQILAEVVGGEGRSGAFILEAGRLANDVAMSSTKVVQIGQLRHTTKAEILKGPEGE